MKQIQLLLQRLVEFHLTVNLVKTEIGHATVIFLGHVVIQGQVSPVQAKVEYISKLPMPGNKKGVIRVFGIDWLLKEIMPQFCRCGNTFMNILIRETKLHLCNLCQVAFEKNKIFLMILSVLQLLISKNLLAL